MVDKFIPPEEKIIAATASTSQPERCANCRYFLPDPLGANPAFCRRFPPVAFLVNIHRNGEGAIIGNEQMSLMPITNEANWCGEWEPRRGTVN